PVQLDRALGQGKTERDVVEMDVHLSVPVGQGLHHLEERVRAWGARCRVGSHADPSPGRDRKLSPLPGWPGTPLVPRTRARPAAPEGGEAPTFLRGPPAP